MGGRDHYLCNAHLPDDKMELTRLMVPQQFGGKFTYVEQAHITEAKRMYLVTKCEDAYFLLEYEIGAWTKTREQNPAAQPPMQIRCLLQIDIKKNYF